MPLDQLTINYPSGFEDAVSRTKPEMAEHVQLMAALKMFELGEVSAGQAAEFAGLSRPGFFEACSKYRVSAFNYGDEEVAAELQADLAAARDAITR